MKARRKKPKSLRTLVYDLLATVGWAMIGYGFYLWYGPLAWLWLGGVLFVLGVWGVRHEMLELYAQL